MEQHSQVLTTLVDFEGETYEASYFIEHGIIHANIDGRIIQTPLSSVDATQTVQAVLRGYLLQTHRKAQQRNSWSGYAEM
jgi:hypothetical protein